jgi:hypothetical protein
MRCPAHCHLQQAEQEFGAVIGGQGRIDHGSTP